MFDRSNLAELLCKKTIEGITWTVTATSQDAQPSRKRTRSTSPERPAEDFSDQTTGSNNNNIELVISTLASLAHDLLLADQAWNSEVNNDHATITAAMMDNTQHTNLQSRHRHACEDESTTRKSPERSDESALSSPAPVHKTRRRQNTILDSPDESVGDSVQWYRFLYPYVIDTRLDSLLTTHNSTIGDAVRN